MSNRKPPPSDSTTLKAAKVVSLVEEQVRRMTLAELRAAEIKRRLEAMAEQANAYFAGSASASARSGQRRSARPQPHVSIPEAVLGVCADVWLAPTEVIDAVSAIRPDTLEKSVYPELMRLKNSGRLLERDGRYKTA